MAGIPNDFLLRLGVHNDVIPNCFCVDCRERRLIATRNLTQQRLYHMFSDVLPLRENGNLNKLFENTLKQIVVGSVYKDTALVQSGYRYFKAWAKQENQFAHLSKKELTLLCNKVNEASSVFSNWDQIVANLTDGRMTQIDARRFSVRQFFLAKSLDWCINYNEILRKKNRRTDEPLYPADKYAAIFQHIVASGILHDVDHDPQIASVIGSRLQLDMVTYCRRRFHPYQQ